MNVTELQADIIRFNTDFPNFLVLKACSKLFKIHSKTRVVCGVSVAVCRTSVIMEAGKRNIIPPGICIAVFQIVIGIGNAEISPCTVLIGISRTLCPLYSFRFARIDSRGSLKLYTSARGRAVGTCARHQKCQNEIHTGSFACVNIKHNSACAAPTCSVDTLLCPRRLILNQRFIVPVLGYLRVLCVIHARVAPVHPQF